ncbi:ribonuclease HI [Dermabacteraceae bacterium TAE3-ERU27]|nr:ribonuclease HI [Dermabacteraceae bacterium TAE3-ERU27]
MTIIAAADGSSLGNPGPAGWAWFIDEQTWAAGGWERGTNNMGELEAVANLLEQTSATTEPLLILCDSQYVINSVTKWMPGWKRNGWRKKDKKPVLNVDILQRIDALLVGRQVRFEWVKGHAGHDLNERADDLARAAATAYQSGSEVKRGPGYPAGAAQKEQGGAARQSVPGECEDKAAPEASAPAYAQDDLFAFSTVGCVTGMQVTPEQEALEETKELLLNPARYGEMIFPATGEHPEISGYVTWHATELAPGMVLVTAETEVAALSATWVRENSEGTPLRLAHLHWSAL